MPPYRILVRLLAMIALIAFVFLIQTFAQPCDCSDIPRAIRPARMAAADEALRVADQQQNALKKRHSPYGVPKSPRGVANERLLFQFEWLTLYDDDLGVPYVTAYELTKAELLSKGVPTRDGFRPDPRWESHDASSCDDYKNSGYDRGHMVPANDLKRSFSSMDNSFLFSNMTAQYGKFNRGVWERLEENVNDWAEKKDGLFVISGAVFDRDGDRRRDPDPSAVRIKPLFRVAFATHYYKILIRRRPDGILETISFLLPHNEIDYPKNTGKDAYLKTTIRSINEIEKVTGIDFFPDMPRSVERFIEAGKAPSIDAWFIY